MKDSKLSNLWLIVVVSLVVAVIASVATSSVTKNIAESTTGNTIRIAPSPGAPLQEIYTKKEIDNKLIESKADVLKMLGQCRVTGTFGGSTGTLMSCSNSCKNIGKSCSLATINYRNPKSGDIIGTELYEC